MEESRDMVVNMLDCDIVVSKIKLQFHYYIHFQTNIYEKGIVIFWPSTRPKKMLFQGDTPEGSDTFQWPVIERDRVGGLRLMIWDKMKVPLCHYSDAPEESNLWTAWQLFPLDDD